MLGATALAMLCAGCAGSGMEPARSQAARIHQREQAMKHARQANELMHARKFSEAKREFLEALKYEPRDSHLLIGAGAAALQEPDLTTALRCLTQATEQDPSSPFAWRGLGHAYIALDDKAAAIDSFEKAFALHPTDFRISADLARLYHFEKYFSKCLEHINHFEQNVARIDTSLLSAKDQEWIAQVRRVHARWRAELDPSPVRPQLRHPNAL